MAITSSFQGTKVLVTGATGFIGSRLCERLMAEGASVYGACRDSSCALVPGVTRMTTALEDAESSRQLVSQIVPQYVFHLAGVTNAARDATLLLPTFQANLVTTVNLLAALIGQGCRRMVFAGSFEEPEAVDEVTSSPYAASKWAARSYGRMSWALFQVPFVNARTFMVYGPGQRDIRKLIPYTILSLLDGQAPKISVGARPVDWIYIDDVVEGLLALAQAQGVDGQSVDVGTGHLVTVREVVEKLTRFIDPELQPAFGSAQERPRERVGRADVERSARLTGWRPSVYIEEGLRRTIDYYRDSRRG
jgi:UDP-glucose 4-epimerase